VKVPIDGLGVSNTVRGAMASWAKTLSNELGGYGITVNNVLPGFTDTDRLRELIAARANAAGLKETVIEEKMKESVPAGRFATPEEIAAMVCFLASPFASYVNGTSIRVDGGKTGSI
ncbi:MAG: SDR family oxidoreductase, partial [Bacteroidota bacterium]